MDWLSAGHKFAERYGHGNSKHDDSERSPIFLQVFNFLFFFPFFFLYPVEILIFCLQLFDAIWQLLRQFPDAFEFHENLLLFILDQVLFPHYPFRSFSL